MNPPTKKTSNISKNKTFLKSVTYCTYMLLEQLAQSVIDNSHLKWNFLISITISHIYKRKAKIHCYIPKCLKYKRVSNKNWTSVMITIRIIHLVSYITLISGVWVFVALYWPIVKHQEAKNLDKIIIIAEKPSTIPQVIIIWLDSDEIPNNINVSGLKFVKKKTA